MTSDDTGDQVDDLAAGGYLRHDYDAGGTLPKALGLIVNDTGRPVRVLTSGQLNAELAGARVRHCAHWQEGDGPCCKCGEPNWCPDDGETPEALAQFEQRGHCDGPA